MTTPAPSLARSTSLFLDVLRLVAAFSVFGTHVIMLWYPHHYGVFDDHFGQRAVIIFFVLSGYVIAYSTLRRENDPRAYVTARLSRLYSVVLPALVLTALLHVVGRTINPAFYQQAERGHEVLRYVLAALFLQSAWFTSSSPGTNGAFWSLGYEFWYYALFGAALLIKPWRGKWAAILALALICGPNVLLLMPSWLLGAACYRYGQAARLPKPIALFGLALAVTGVVLSYPFLPDWPYSGFNVTLFYSASFGSDGVFGLLVALVIWLFDQAFREVAVPERIDNPVRWLADHTFSLYLYHFPILFFFAAVVPFDRHNAPVAAAMIVLVLALILGLSVFTESKRNLWRKMFGRVWDGLFRQSAGPAHQPR